MSNCPQGWATQDVTVTQSSPWHVQRYPAFWTHKFSSQTSTMAQRVKALSTGPEFI